MIYYNCYYFEEEMVKFEGGHTNVYELLLQLAVD